MNNTEKTQRLAVLIQLYEILVKQNEFDKASKIIEEIMELLD